MTDDEMNDDSYGFGRGLRLDWKRLGGGYWEQGLLTWKSLDFTASLVEISRGVLDWADTEKQYASPY